MSLQKNAPDGWIYLRDKEREARYLLGRPGKNNLVFVGINPNTANPEKLDRTATRINNLITTSGFEYEKGKSKCDGWIMINLSPQISRYPKDLLEDNNKNEEIIKENIKAIKSLNKYKIGCIYAAWGNAIENKKRKYLVNTLKEIVDILGDKNWYHKGTLTQKNHPRHPLYVSSKTKMKKVKQGCVAQYINNLNNKIGN